MRPIERGTSPSSFSCYQDAIGYLESRLGTYCSYCERRLPISLAVEHMAPKSLNPEKELDWGNFLLGCTNCNSVKGDTDIQEENYLWPDRDNTMLAICYREGGFVETSLQLDSDKNAKAFNLIELVGLDRHPVFPSNKPANRDKRWLQRDEVWEIAKNAKNNYESLDRSEAALNLIIDIAKGYGFFSIWYQVFEQHIEVKRNLRDVFAGTALGCFDDDLQLINREGGAL